MKQLLDTIINQYCEYVKNDDTTENDLIVGILKTIIAAYQEYNIEKPALPEYMMVYFEE